MTGPLIEAAELAVQLAAGADLTVLDVRWTLSVQRAPGDPTGRADFERGHLPGAQWVDLDHELSAPPGEGGRHPLPAPAVFEAAMRRVGVSSERGVIVYDAANSLAASRLWWLLTDAGHDDVRVLDGGLGAWVAAGHDLESGPADPVAPGTFSAQPGRRVTVSAGEIVELTTRGARPELVDVRAPERFTGATEPLDPVAGHIPGALNLPSMAHVDAAGHFLPAEELAVQFADLETPVFYCGSGITAAHSLLALEATGRTGAIYPGSWSDWITDPERPVATGP